MNTVEIKENKNLIKHLNPTTSLKTTLQTTPHFNMNIYYDNIIMETSTHTGKHTQHDTPPSTPDPVPAFITTTPVDPFNTTTPIPTIGTKRQKQTKKQRILVIGYYFHNNIGDDQYIDVFNYILKNNFNQFHIKFVDCDKLPDTNIKKTDIIIIGGGDILNHYFLDKINWVFKEKQNKIIAVSVGIPYLDILINTRKLDIIDYIFVRTKQEHYILKEFYCVDRIFYLPDLSYFMKNVNILFDNSTYVNNTIPPSLYNRVRTIFQKNSSQYETLTATTPFYFENICRRLVFLNRNTKVFGFMLNRHIYSKENNERYINIVKEIAKVVKWLLLNHFAIVFLPFNNFNGNDITYYTENCENCENDVLLHNDVYEEVVKIIPENEKYIKNIVNIQHSLTTKETFELFKYIDYAIPMRFHATLYSIYNHIPFVSVYTTRKIRNLLIDINYNEILKYELVVDKNDVPIGIDADILQKKIGYLLSSKTVGKETRHYLKCVCHDLEKELNRGIYIFLHLIENAKDIQPHKNKLINVPVIEPIQAPMTALVFDPVQAPITAPVPTHIRDDSTIYNDVIVYLISKLADYCGNNQDFRMITDPHKQKVIISIISYYLTGGNLHSIFNYGMAEKIFFSKTGVIYEYWVEWKWVIKENLLKGGCPPIRSLENMDEVENQLPFSIRPTPEPRFNIHYFNQQDNSGVHRSGWNYVYNELQKYHTSVSTAPLLDIYIDRTFHWEKETLKAIGIIPYCKKWRGFIHHTFNTSFSEFNNHNLLKTPEFLDSLTFCEMLYVLSNTLKIQLLNELSKIGWDKIPVVSLIHPTEIEGVPPFQYKCFLENPDKRVLHIGGWLRNTLSFYHLSLPTTVQFYSYKKRERFMEYIGFKPKRKDVLNKTVMVNKNGGNYHPLAGTEKSVLNSLKKVENNVWDTNFHNACGGGSGVCSGGCGGGCGDVCIEESNHPPIENILYNNWNKQFYEFFQQMVGGVERIGKITNEEYDTFLTNNIVFLYLIDGAATNTLIECCVRNTPVFINKHPSVVELLGDKYPLFYEADNTTISPSSFFNINQQFVKLLSDPLIIYKTHQYLVSLNKMRFHINYFKYTFFHTF